MGRKRSRIFFHLGAEAASTSTTYEDYTVHTSTQSCLLVRYKPEMNDQNLRQYADYKLVKLFPFAHFRLFLLNILYQNQLTK
jgi:hypothetical protein